MDVWYGARPFADFCKDEVVGCGDGQEGEEEEIKHGYFFG